MVKYLYGKKSVLQPLINGDVGFRFSDLSHYSRMENEEMRDEEMAKIFTIDRRANEVKINGHILTSLVRDPEIRVTPRHCFCLCLSNKKNSNELYDKFEADVCIEVKSDLLIESLVNFHKHNLKGMEVVGKDITYYSKGHFPSDLTTEDFVFYKPDSFKHEDEYRIALFYPESKTSFETDNGDNIPLLKDDESTHIFFNNSNREFLKQFIGKYFEKTA